MMYNWKVTLVVQSTGREIVRSGDGGFDMEGYAKAEALGQVNSTVFWQGLPDDTYLKEIKTFPEVADGED